ncbi:Gfo/Idh/MocA family protein [Jiangella mangrovi]|uniref:Putative dehydrogenase n=1 Tax=Jiangella mangrovi TaxID=1524084 RepID=A0A7W9LPX2_9ACTN|nr:putative dehydrogenase [Jiangella mangrovi]
MTGDGVGVGLVGSGGHQVTVADVEACGGRVLAASDDVETVLADDAVRLVSVCQTPRSAQVASALRALEAGRHVLIERPCAASAGELERLEQAACRSGTILCERATTPFEQPYRLARELVADGVVGDVVQVLVSKSYPYADWRPQDESVQGGLVLQAAVYGLDCVLHVAGGEIESLELVDTTLGNPGTGALRMAANVVATLRGGGVAGIAANYLNPPGSGAWGRDDLVIFGTAGRLHAAGGVGSVEVVRAGGATVHACAPGPSLLAELLAAVETGAPMTVPPGDLLGATRCALLALRPGSRSARRVSWAKGRWWR